MPILNFKCRHCGEIFVEVVHSAIGEVYCPYCGGDSEIQSTNSLYKEKSEMEFNTEYLDKYKSGDSVYSEH